MPSARTTLWWLLRDLVKRPVEETPGQRAFMEHLLTLCPQVRQLQALTFAFASLLRRRQGRALAPWPEAAHTSGLTELARFVTGLRRDLAAVQAACTSRWSKGQVEGQINRLKLLTRQMYGRATFDLLKARVLYTAGQQTYSEGEQRCVHQNCG